MSQDRAAAWAALNERQQTYMRVVYDADQAAEQRAKGAWARGERSQPAAEWRWLDYGTVGDSMAPLGRLQRNLEARGVRDSGAGSTLTALEKAGLIETQSVPGVVGYRLLVKLTRHGRAVCRAGGVDSARPGSPGRGQLSEGLWGMLVDVHAAGEEGLRRDFVDGWLRLTEREPEPYVVAEPDRERRYGYRLRLTEAGARYYADQWEAYARLYPAVDALRPDGGQAWPGEVDRALGVLDARCQELRGRLDGTVAEAERLPSGVARRVPKRPDLPELEALTTARNRAARAYDLALVRAAEQYRAALDTQRVELEGLYRQACVRYAAVATAVVAAVAAGTDPAAAVAAVEPVTEWPWLPPEPVTGLAEIDVGLSRQWRRTSGAPEPRRGRKRPQPVQIEPDGLEGRLAVHAGYLATLVRGGKLARLMLRR
ncbi:hypothetical protein [Streptosporangium sp. NPDC051022]|uniref:hypothetical protein n=1 Tax=Streptosporangium sp. NPDC051022 TaxID=3155752 RepID=UPI0034122053